MGEVDERKYNPKIPSNMIDIYLDMEASYNRAQENILEFGEIVSHPRTGEAMENPYLSVREKASKQMLSIQSKYKRMPIFI